jgi:hypothetical protein
VLIEEPERKIEELAEEVEVSDCLDEFGGLYLRKLLLQLKQDYNFSLESTIITMQTKKSTIIFPVVIYGSIVESIQ